MNSIKLNTKRTIVILAIIALLMLLNFAFWWWRIERIELEYRQAAGQETEEMLKGLKERPIDDWSRISLLSNDSSRLSLAIPAYWEGNYRVIESSGQAEFYYISDPRQPLLFLAIKRIMPGLEMHENDVVLHESKSEILTYNLSTAVDIEKSDDLLLKRMLGDRERVIRTYIVK